MVNLNQELMHFIIEHAKVALSPNAIILFGSRARGDARETSDYDIAFDFNLDLHHNDWGKFCVEMQSDAPTLLPMDLVNMNEIDDVFRDKILREGIVVYKGK